MSDKENINEKVINIFKNAETEEHQPSENPAIKFFAGVSYVRLDEDINGRKFDKKSLIENAADFSYIVRVLKPKNRKYSLYNYNVPYDKIVDFIAMFAKNELSGTIIEIDKYKPNEPA